MRKFSKLFLGTMFLVAGLSLGSMGCGGVAAEAEQSQLTVAGDVSATPIATAELAAPVAACAADVDTGACTNGGTNCGKTTSGKQCTCMTYARGCGCGIANPGGTFTPCNLAQ